jgi:hypothetical protein
MTNSFSRKSVFHGVQYLAMKYKIVFKLDVSQVTDHFRMCNFTSEEYLKNAA